MFKKSSSGGHRRYQLPAHPAHFAPDFAVRPGDSYIASPSASHAYQTQTDFVMRHDHTSYTASQPFQPDFAIRPGQTYNAGIPPASYSTDFAPRACNSSYNAGQPVANYNSYGPGIYAQPASLSFAPIPSSAPAPGLHRSNAHRNASTSSRSSGHSSSSHGSSSSRSHGQSHGHSHGQSSSRHGSSHSSSHHHSSSSSHRRHREPHSSSSRHTQYFDCVEYQ